MAVSFFCFFGVGSCRPTIIAANLPAICRGGIHPSRVPSAAANSHGGQRAGRPTYDPGRAADLRGAIAANLPAICRGRIHAARNLPTNPFHGQSAAHQTRRPHIHSRTTLQIKNLPTPTQAGLFYGCYPRITSGRSPQPRRTVPAAPAGSGSPSGR